MAFSESNSMAGESYAEARKQFKERLAIAVVLAEDLERQFVLWGQAIDRANTASPRGL